MPGEIQGAWFKAIIGSMTAASSRFPNHQRTINTMRDDQWYAWDDYVHMLEELHAALGDRAVEAIAQRSAMRTLPLARTMGFDSVEKVFGDFGALLRALVRGLPETEHARTVAFMPLAAEVESHSRLPASLLLGTFRGFLMGFGKIVTEAKVTSRHGVHRFSLKWM
ncbi:endo-1,4-beta-xylanase [Myxococcus sp. K15C18031901]|uniref:endo-1,4-beta-xylanase n=1 Tax=Myxococcus dinghuensis TaxID=2906761 RepID=UPI0020A79A1F|nr:endo-1,4-beta-xylanase [Myxococcus dinghuensis]MCP3100693.1 endo-1,4-beta-xylanase [Myxococcus dinghuensis]